MASIPPPQGMSEVDYEAIEAAVTETVRGRWFLAEFARRNRIAETRQLLDAMARLEAVVTSGQPALPSADPSIRLLIQRIKEIAGQLGVVAGDMRTAGIEERFVEAVDLQARAVSGMMRSATPSLTPGKPGERRAVEAARPAEAATPAHAVEPPPTPAVPPQPSSSMPRMPRAELPAAFARPGPPAPETDPRLAALAEIDALPLEQKLALFR